MTSVTPPRTPGFAAPDEGLPVGWNDTAAPFEADATIDEVVDARATERPDAPAIVEGARTLTYGELEERASALGVVLGEYFDGPDQTVGVFAPRSIDAIVAFYGVMKAGAAFVPLESELPDERLAFLAEDAGVRAIVAPPGLTGAAARVGRAPVVELGSPGPSSAAPRRIETGPTSLAYVMYTSGSTGRPKGVEIEHRGVLRYVRGARGLLPEPGESMLHVGQIGFDASTYEVWGALCNGARVVVHPGSRFEPSRVAATIGENGADVAMFTAGALHLMVDAQLDALGRLRLILAAGDVLSPGHARRLLAAHPHTRLVNAYGPTETSVTASVYDVTRVEPGRSIPIGRPLANTTLHVLDDDLAPVPPGEVGELCVGGVGVARGYRGLAGQTAERFVDDPFDVGGRLYRTGDRVRLLPGGDLEFLGRRDDQVKIRGYRVEPAEVAAALSAHPDVSSVEVAAAPGPRGRPRLIAFVVASRRGIADDLTRLARRRLPDYLVPTEVVEVDAFPLTSTGKVDRGALVDGVRRRALEPPRTITEALVATAVARALDLDGVGANDDFFDLGGDSLAALQVLVALEETAGASLGLADVFEARTVDRLALRVDALAGAARRLPPLEAAPLSRGAPASLTQAQACFLAELALPHLPYQSSAVLELTGDLDVEALERAAQAVVDRHDVLRTAIPKVGGGWVLRAVDGAAAPFEVVDLRDDPDPVASFGRLLDDRLHRRIDLEAAPLVRWTLARLRDDHARLIQVEHHAVHDGWSFARVVGDLLGAYRDLSEGRDPGWAPAPRYRDFAHWQRSLPQTDVGRAQLDYWERVLDGAAPPPSISRRPAPGATFAGGAIRRDLPAALVDEVRATARRAGATAFQVM
ncbi:MAG TPA: amino acid adenylation domain-containing protein, partial [Acidimicrobiales bacterium]|nr:amino acid adenylation domain-containing protein [Acidimicrobiales bacterium]